MNPRAAAVVGVITITACFGIVAVLGISFALADSSLSTADVVPQDPVSTPTVSYNETGIASWYGPGFHGNHTASGEVYDMYGVSAAHKTLPLGTIVRVVELSTEKSIVVRINDRGPFIEGRIIDLSKGAAEKLGIVEKGITQVGLIIYKEKMKT